MIFYRLLIFSIVYPPTTIKRLQLYFSGKLIIYKVGFILGRSSFKKIETIGSDLLFYSQCFIGYLLKTKIFPLLSQTKNRPVDFSRII